MKTFLILFAQLNLVLFLSILMGMLVHEATGMTDLEAFWFYFSVGVIAIVVGTLKEWFDDMFRMR